MAARCCFYILNRDDPGYSPALYPEAPMGQLGLALDEVPAVGDLIALSGRTADPAGDEQMVSVAGVWRVLARQWSPAQFGSMSWKSGDRQPDPVTVDMMLERVDGLFDAAHYSIAA